MGVNMAGNCIIDDDSCREAANQEIIRRYYHCLCELKRGNSSKDILYKLQLLMKQAGLTINDRPVVKAAMQREEETGHPRRSHRAFRRHSGNRKNLRPVRRSLRLPSEFPEGSGGY